MAVTASDIVSTLRATTFEFYNMQPLANMIDNENGQLYVHDVNNSLGNITTYIHTKVKAMSSMQPFTKKSDQQSVLDAFVTFSTDTQRIQDTLARKADMLTTPNAGLLSLTLISQQSVVGDFAIKIIGACPDVKEVLTAQHITIKTSIGKAITALTSRVKAGSTCM